MPPCELPAGLAILERHGFVFERHGKGSHRVYEAHHSGQRWTVILSYGQLGEDIKPGTLSSIIRQSGLSKSDFRNRQRRVSDLPLPPEASP